MNLDSLDSLVHSAALGGAWVLTYLLHSALVFVAVALLARACDQRPALVASLWRAAILAPILATSASMTLGVTSPAGQIPLSELHIVREVVVAPGHAGVLRDVLPPFIVPMPETYLLAGLLLVAVLAGLVGAARLLLLHRARAYQFGDRRRCTDPRVGAILADLAARRLAPPGVRVSVHQQASSPVALMGAEICLPARGSELSDRELAALLAHEATHLGRRDPHWLLLLGSLCSLLAVQPLNRLALQRFSACAELACDDRAALASTTPLDVGRVLLRVAGWRLEARDPLLAYAVAHPDSLSNRIERLLGRRRRPEDPAGERYASVAAGLGALLVWALVPGFSPMPQRPTAGAGAPEIELEVEIERVHERPSR